MITVMSGCSSSVDDIPNTPDELLNQYFNIRYHEVHYSNLYDAVDKLSKFYSKELLSGESWLTNQDNIADTYNTMETLGINSELKSLEIRNVEGNMYQAAIYVLYNTENVVNTHYIYYLMNIELCEENHRYKIDNIDVAEKIPVFTGGLDMDLESVVHEISEIQGQHNH